MQCLSVRRNIGIIIYKLCVGLPRSAASARSAVAGRGGALGLLCSARSARRAGQRAAGRHALPAVGRAAAIPARTPQVSASSPYIPTIIYGALKNVRINPCV